MSPVLHTQYISLHCNSGMFRKYKHSYFINFLGVIREIFRYMIFMHVSVETCYMYILQHLTFIGDSDVGNTNIVICCFINTLARILTHAK